MNEYIKYWDEHVVERHVGQDINYIKRYFQKKNINKVSYIDIGANVGKIYDCLKDTFTIEKCIMVEASKSLFDYLQEKFKNNNNVEIFNFAIAEKSGHFGFYEETLLTVDSCSLEMNLGLSKLENREGNTVCHTMDYFLNNFCSLKPQEISFIKIDTETKDLFILRDLAKFINFNSIQPFILFENNYHNDMSLEEAQTIVDNFCSLCKYEPLNLATSSGDCVIYPIENN